MFTDLNEVFQAAMAYVITSRVTSINQLYLKKFDQKKIYCNVAAKAEVFRLKKRALNLQVTEWEEPGKGIQKRKAPCCNYVCFVCCEY